MTASPQGEVKRALRPPGLPDDVDDARAEKTTGVVALPLRVRWSAPLHRFIDAAGEVQP